MTHSYFLIITAQLKLNLWARNGLRTAGTANALGPLGSGMEE